MNAPFDRALRERCIELALRFPSGGDPVKAAQRFHAFITGEELRSDADAAIIAAYRRLVEELQKSRDRARA